MAIGTVGAAAGAPPGPSDRTFCVAMLPKVSRTFAICIRLLPADLAHPVLIAYLLCRIADTVEDTAHLSAPRKLELLERFGEALAPGGRGTEPLRQAFADPGSDEEVLAREADRVLREFQRLAPVQRDAIRPWVQEMSGGMAEFARRKGNAGASRLEALTTVEELDRYCYYVAGTVGHLLTALFDLHDGAGNQRRRERLESLSTSFGLGLQLTNIIKDVADDRRRGWVFVPRELCQLAGVTPDLLLDPGRRDSGRQVMTMLIDKAKRHLVDALEYSTTLPRSQYGIRLFCLTALYFAVRTIRLAEADDRLLDPEHKVKISRGEVRRTLLMTRIVAPSNRLTRRYFRWLAGPGWPDR